MKIPVVEETPKQTCWLACTCMMSRSSIQMKSRWKGHFLFLFWIKNMIGYEMSLLSHTWVIKETHTGVGRDKHCAFVLVNPFSLSLKTFFFSTVVSWETEFKRDNWRWQTLRTVQDHKLWIKYEALKYWEHNVPNSWQTTRRRSCKYVSIILLH